METENKIPEKNSPWEKSAGHLSIGDLVRLSLRIFKTKPTRTFLTALGMSLGVGVVLFLISLGYGLQYLLIGRLVTSEDALITVEAYYPPDSNVFITPKDIEEIKLLPQFQEVSSVGEFPAELKLADGGGSGYLLSRIVPYNYDRLSGVFPDIAMKTKDKDDEMRGVTVSNAALKTIGLPADETSLGKELSLTVYYPVIGGSPDEVRPVKTDGNVVIKGIISDETQPPFIIVPQKMVGDNIPPYYQTVFVKPTDLNGVEPIRNALLADGMLVSSRIDMVNQVKKVMSIVTITLGVFGITALIVSAIGMFNTMLISFLERIYEVGIMKALGATNRDIRNMFIMESLIMGLLGGLGGILLGVGMGEAANLGINLLANSLGGKKITLFVRPLWFLGLVLGLSSLIGVFSGFWPARRATKVSPQEAFIRK